MNDPPEEVEQEFVEELEAEAEAWLEAAEREYADPEGNPAPDR